MTKLKKFIGDGRFYKMAFAIILPIMLQQLLLSLAGYVDSLMINSFDTSHFAYNGVSAANRVMMIINFVLLGFASAASIFISQFYGAINRKKINESLNLAIVVAAALGVICFVVLHFFGYKIVDLYLVGEESRAFGYRYMDVIKWGTVITSLNMIFSSGFRAAKQTVLPLIACIIGILVNVVLNYGLIFGKLGMPCLDSAGAAIATNVSRAVELTILVLYALFWKKSPFKGFWRDWHFSKTLKTAYLKKCTPLTLNELLWSLGMALYALFYTYQNDLWYNAYAYSQNITDLFFIIFAGLGNGTAVIVGTALGADDFERAKRDAYRMIGLGIAMSLVVMVAMWLTAPYILDIFQPSPVVKEVAVGVINVSAIFVVIYAYNATCFFILRAGGDSTRAFILDQGATYIVGLPIAAVLGLNAASLGISLPLVFLATHACDVVKLFVSAAFVKKGAWIKNLAAENSDMEIT